MLVLLQPLWLLAALGISIPVVIHLWNVRQGKTVKIGSIALLKDNSSRARRIQLTEWLLLLLRCLLLVLTAFLLAQPLWKSSSNTEKGWILTAPGQFKETYRQFKKPVDSLLQKGFELHEFDTTFRKVSLNEVLKTDTGFSAATYTSLLRLLQEKLPAGYPVYLFTGDHTDRLGNTLPHPTVHLTWKTYTPADSVKQGMVSAWLTSEDSIRLLTVSSYPSKTVTALLTLSANTNNDRFYATVKNGNRVVQSRDPAFAATSIPIDTTTLRTGIFAGSNGHDAGYLDAALRSIRQFTGRKITSTVFNDPAGIPKNLDWLFWLADQAPSPQFRAGLPAGTRLFLYAGGNYRQADELMNIANVPPVPLNRVVIPPAADTGTVLWTTGAGDPLLSESNATKNRVYYFYSRFNPEWNDLVWNGYLPAAVMDLVMPARFSPAADSRRFPVPPMMTMVSRMSKLGGSSAGYDLRFISWIATAFLFAVERWYSSKRLA